MRRGFGRRRVCPGRGSTHFQAGEVRSFRTPGYSHCISRLYPGRGGPAHGPRATLVHLASDYHVAAAQRGRMPGTPLGAKQTFFRTSSALEAATLITGTLTTARDTILETFAC